ncbi:hypothetical protein Z517_07847 [Fonsecaea pedrosoi CBS 271.37]|uniref:Major facilitator superfamily (MFS) profile domain-containing protein n=1 Tax=Fonsecaea pedrosoi CBS 271.37 TaxID=1442368 RepID=A0A0D2H069_9EURO|nr:uncharacterized protein Z517_07847 [Fonsecaea pedrosoi CBS 271.37]KIW78014.1 hypothetical protein Z517_07847 [Fonsecaea pedrosoi CBS 271.37]
MSRCKADVDDPTKVVLGIALATSIYGYASNVMAGSFAQPTFIAKFLPADKAAAYQGALVGIYYGGAFIGSFLQQPISDRYGRRVAMGMGSLIVCISGALCAASYHLPMLLVFRFMTGIGGAMVLTVSPQFIGELSPPHSRGWLVSLNVVGQDLGYVTSAATAFGFSWVTELVQWRLNFILMSIFALFITGLMYFIPESPRWLVQKERYEDALAVLKRVHSHSSDVHFTLAKAEMIQIREQVSLENKLPRGYLHIWRTPALRRRALSTVLVWITAMSTGILVLANYIPILFGGLGYGFRLQLGLSVAWLGAVLFGAISGGIVADSVGRVRLMAGGAYTCAFCLAMEAVVAAKWIPANDIAGLRTGVAFFFLFGFFYNFWMDPSCFVYTSEIWPSHLRTEGVSLAMATYFGATIAWASPASTGFQNIGYKYYLILISVGVVCGTLCLLVLPETKGLSLEEIGELFGEEPVVRLRDMDVDNLDSTLAKTEQTQVVHAEHKV